MSEPCAVVPATASHSGRGACSSATGVCSENGEIHAAVVLRATLSADQRVIDGADAAAFMGALRRTIERPHGIS